MMAMDGIAASVTETAPSFTAVSPVIPCMARACVDDECKPDEDCDKEKCHKCAEGLGWGAATPKDLKIYNVAVDIIVRGPNEGVPQIHESSAAEALHQSLLVRMCAQEMLV